MFVTRSRRRGRLRRASWVRTGVYALAAASVAGCAGDLQPEPIEGQTAPLFGFGAALGKELFERPFPHTNGRACATCHVLDEATTLRPESVEKRLREDPNDPLFDRIDADDPLAAVPTFEHLKKGLVRVVLPLAENVDVIDAQGNVITPADRTIFVWRGVPSVADTASTAPYQLDGREPSLQTQAQGAILSHSAGPNVSGLELELIATFQRTLFSSPRARFVSQMLELGFPEEHLSKPEDYARLSPEEQRGRAVYEAACAACHGGVTTNRIENRAAQAFLMPELTSEGNVRYEVTPGLAPTIVRRGPPTNDFMNAGFGAATYFAQIGLAPAFHDSVELPRYRLRFYRDATRSERLVDLPPTPVTVSGDPFDPRPALDARGAPIVGPNLIPQAFTTDPGRAAITGDPNDFESFDVPQLRGIARTAPYYHDNLRLTLREVVDDYSQFLLRFLTPLALPEHPPEQPGGRREALSPQQKSDLIKFLEKL